MKYGSKAMGCHYMLDTGKSRGCSGRECYENKIHFDPEFVPVKWCGRGGFSFGNKGQR